MATNAAASIESDRRLYMNLSLEEKRKRYACGSKFVTLDQIPTWQDYQKTLPGKSAYSLQPFCAWVT